MVTQLAQPFNKLNISKHVAPTHICMAIPLTACKQSTLHDGLSTMAEGSHCSTGQRLSIACRCHPAPTPHQGPTKEERAIEAAKQRNRQQQLQRFSNPAHGPFHLLTAERPTNTQQLKQQVRYMPVQLLLPHSLADMQYI